MKTNDLKPSDELTKEIMEYIFSAKVNHRDCLKVWEENPWKAVSMYEALKYPDYLELPLIMPGQVKTNDSDASDKEIDAFLNGTTYYEERPRATEGVYDSDGTKMIVNKFGRLENPEDIYGPKGTD